MVWAGRNTEDPSARWNSSGTGARSGGVRRTDPTSAAATIRATTAVPSVGVANRSPAVCRDASAWRFQYRHVDRFSPTTPTTASARRSTIAAGTSPAATGRWVSWPRIDEVQPAGSPSRCTAARVCHSSVRSARDRTVLSGLVDRVACWRSLMIVFDAGPWP